MADPTVGKTDAAESAAFDRVANLILDCVEEVFHIVAPDGRDMAKRAIVNILAYYTNPKVPEPWKQ